MNAFYSGSQSSSRKAITGFDPLLNAYFLNLLENDQDATQPLLFPFQGEDDSNSAKRQQQKMCQYKNYWVQEGKSVDEIIQLHAVDVSPEPEHS